MKRTSSNRQSRAFTITELLLITFIISIAAGVFLSSMNRAKMKDQRINCFNTLKAVGLSFRLWVDENDGKFPMQASVTNGGSMEFVANGETFRHFQVMSNELSTPKVIVCPSDHRQAATNFTTGLSNSNVSYFVGVDAEDGKAQTLLIGDRNILNGRNLIKGILELTTNNPARWTRAMHSREGNVGLADGSVQQVTIAGLQKLIERTGMATNRISLP